MPTPIFNLVGAEYGVLSGLPTKVASGSSGWPEGSDSSMLKTYHLAKNLSSFGN
jgi:hypothetical protein